MTSTHLWNTLNNQRSLYQQTATLMRKYYQEFGAEALSNVFNLTVKDEQKALWRADKVTDYNLIKGQTYVK